MKKSEFYGYAALFDRNVWTLNTYSICFVSDVRLTGRQVRKCTKEAKNLRAK